MKKRILSAVIILVGLGLIWFALRKPAQTISADTTVHGDYSVAAGKKVILEKGAVLTVDGNATIQGELSCQDGLLNLVVKGNLDVEGKLTCHSGNNGVSGIAAVINGSVVIGARSEISSDGSVQFAQSEQSLATSPDQIEKLYADAATPGGSGQVIGPLGEGRAQASLPAAQNNFAVASTAQRVGFFSIAQARAADTTVVVGGKITVPTPRPGVRQIVVLNFPDATKLEIKDFELSGPAGRDGQSDIGKSCNARGKDGEDAFRFLAYANNLTVNNFTLNLGAGGNGGNAETSNACDPGMAQGGAGGKGGNFKMVAGNNFQITGAFIVNPGKGGNGGQAIAHGKDGGPSEKGGDATATGGKGADNNKQLGIAGTVAGTENVQIGSLIGGDGGNATANPGKGGDGQGCGKVGGDGGKGTATAGKGGDAKLTLAGAAGRTPGAQDLGGKGGEADSHGGQAGNGGSCGPEGPGGNGGKGGDAKATKGPGGVGTTSNGADGAVKNETGGNGGNGGDGCPPGQGGKGGAGNPPGTDGQPGKNLCVPPKEQPQTQTTNPPAGSTPPPTGQTQAKIQAIEYNGKYLPVDQLIVEDETGCGAQHWHAAQGIVKATDRSFVPDPGPQCGYGKVAEKPVMDVPVGPDYKPGLSGY